MTIFWFKDYFSHSGKENLIAAILRRKLGSTFTENKLVQN